MIGFSFFTHLFLGWTLANAGKLDRRERAAVTIAGVIPDFDAFGAPFEALTRDSARPLLWYSDYHHILGHNLLFGVICTAVGFAVATRRWLVAGLVLVSFHLHLLGDLVGSMGPDGSQWPIPYLWPLDPSVQWTWSGQWELNAWPNFVITGVLLLVTFYLAWRRGYSTVEIVSRRVDARIVEALRRRFGEPPGTGEPAGPESPPDAT